MSFFKDMVRQSKNRHHHPLGYEFLNRYDQRDESSDLIQPGFEVLMQLERWKTVIFLTWAVSFLKDMVRQVKNSVHLLT